MVGPPLAGPIAAGDRPGLSRYVEDVPAARQLVGVGTLFLLLRVKGGPMMNGAIT
jgi:hypothetical protein